MSTAQTETGTTETTTTSAVEVAEAGAAKKGRDPNGPLPPLSGVIDRLLAVIPANADNDATLAASVKARYAGVEGVPENPLAEILTMTREDLTFLKEKLGEAPQGTDESFFWFLMGQMMFEFANDIGYADPNVEGAPAWLLKASQIIRGLNGEE